MHLNRSGDAVNRNVGVKGNKVSVGTDEAVIIGEELPEVETARHDLYARTYNMGMIWLKHRQEGTRRREAGILDAGLFCARSRDDRAGKSGALPGGIRPEAASHIHVSNCLLRMDRLWNRAV